ncbi:MAG: hypothetical protein HQL63_03925 [Magnetococcales bacterium]|nr:hypothetical protein [Magnetococcales bacterium]MBF0323425.1 hypothetical protein [Magnetococcales bacterium]
MQQPKKFRHHPGGPRPEEHFTLLIDPQHLQERVVELASQIEADMAGLDPVLVVILKGGILFGVDLLRAMKQPWPVVFLPRRPPKTPDWITLEDQKLLHGRNLVVVDGILDDGNSLSLLLQRLQFLAPASVRLGVLLHRTVSHALPLPITWVGFEVPHLRVTGYGLDEGERFRGLPGIFTWIETHSTENG